MGNGGVGPFLGAVNDHESNFQREDDNMKTVRRYYDRIYNAQKFDELSSFVSKNVKIRRDKQVLGGRDNLRAQIEHTFDQFHNLKVAVREMVASGARVSYRINVEHDVSDTNPARRRIRGIGHCRLSGGRIVETWVHYEPSEPI
jgi:predicted ester cyclase